MARRQANGRVLKVSVKSQLKFSAESEPAGESALTDIARVFAAHFAETLKTGTSAQSVRIGESLGRKASGEVESIFLCDYSNADALKQAVDLLTTMNAIAVAWAHRDWRQLVPGIMSVSSKVSVDGIVSDAADSAPYEALPQSRKFLLGWLATVLAAFLLGMAAARSDMNLTRDTDRKGQQSAAAKRAEPVVKPVECAAQETPPAAPPVTVNCTCPTVRVSCPSRAREGPTSQRWEALSR